MTSALRSLLRRSGWAFRPFVLGVVTWLTAIHCSGCGPSEPRIVSLDEAADQLEAAFETAPESMHSLATAASGSLKAGRFTQSFTALQALQTQSSNMSSGQRDSVRSALYSLQAKMNEAAAAGDPDATAATEALRLTR